MRITYVNFSPIPSYQANSVNSVMTCQALGRMGHEVEMLIPGFSSARKLLRQSDGNIGNFYCLEPKFRLRYMPFPKLTALGRRGRQALAMVALSKSNEPDIIYTRRLEVAIAAGARGMRAIYEAHNFSKADPRWFDQWVQLLHKAPPTVAMVSTTEASAKGFVDAGVPAERLRVVANGVDFAKYERASEEDIRERYGISQEAKLVTYCGTMGESKGINYILDCAKLLPDMQFLLIGGSSSELDKCRETVNALNLNNVVFSGFIPHGDVPSHLRGSDFLIFTLTRIPGYSHNYCSPMKMFEYMASGKAMVATEFGSIHEVLADGQNALIVDPDNADLLASGLRRLGEDDELAARLGAQAQEDARKYDWSQRAGNITDFIADAFPELLKT